MLLFLCQVSFQLQFSAPSLSAQPRRSYYASLPRAHLGYRDTQRRCPQTW